MKFKDYLRENIYNDFNYFVSFHDINTNEVIHICGYQNPPKVKDINNLFEELENDKDFNIPKEYLSSLSVRIFHRKNDEKK